MDPTITEYHLFAWPCEDCRTEDLTLFRIRPGDESHTAKTVPKCLRCEGLVSRTHPCTFCQRQMKRTRTATFGSEEVELCRACIAAIVEADLVDRTYHPSAHRPQKAHAFWEVERAKVNGQPEVVHRWTAIGNLMLLGLRRSEVFQAIGQPCPMDLRDGAAEFGANDADAIAPTP